MADTQRHTHTHDPHDTHTHTHTTHTTHTGHTRHTRHTRHTCIYIYIYTHTRHTTHDTHTHTRHTCIYIYIYIYYIYIIYIYTHTHTTHTHTHTDRILTGLEAVVATATAPPCRWWPCTCPADPPTTPPSQDTPHTPTPGSDRIRWAGAEVGRWRLAAGGVVDEPRHGAVAWVWGSAVLGNLASWS